MPKKTEFCGNRLWQIHYCCYFTFFNCVGIDIPQTQYRGSGTCTGGIGGAHGRGGGVGVDHQGGHQDVQGLGQGEEFRVETVVSDDYIVLGGCWGND